MAALRCQLCGREVEVPKWHPAYDRAREGDAEPYICEACARAVQQDALREQRPSAPIG